MGFTTKLVLHTARIKNDGTYPLILRVTYYRKIIRVPLGRYFQEADWDAKNQRVRTSCKVVSNTTRLNNLIQKQQRDFYDKLSALELSGNLILLSPKELKTFLLSETKAIIERPSVSEFIDRLIQEKIQLGKKGTALSYRGAKRKLISVLGDGLNAFEQIDYNALKKIEVSHITDGGSYGGLGVYMRTIRSIYNRAIKEKIVSADCYPFAHYRIKTVETQRRALSETDFERFKNLKLQFPLLQGKNYFLASFYMRGMNYIDMAYLKVGNIEGDFERIRYQRNKTGKYFSIKISQPLKTILLKYIQNLNDKDSFIFPILDTQTSKGREYEIIKNKRKRLNQKLKKIANLLQIMPFTIYSARHTYATMGKRRGVPTAIIQESLGHKTEAITQTYLASFENSVVDEYDLLIMR